VYGLSRCLYALAGRAKPPSGGDSCRHTASREGAAADSPRNHTCKCPPARSGDNLPEVPGKDPDPPLPDGRRPADYLRRDLTPLSPSSAKQRRRLSPRLGQIRRPATSWPRRLAPPPSSSLLATFCASNLAVALALPPSFAFPGPRSSIGRRGLRQINWGPLPDPPRSIRTPVLAAITRRLDLLQQVLSHLPEKPTPARLQANASWDLTNPH